MLEIGGNTTGLNKALAETNKSIRTTEYQLKDVERLLKLDPTNTELLAQKQRLLGNAVTETRGKLDALKEAERQAQEQFKKGEISQQQYDSLQREITATEQQLKSFESQAQKGSVSLNQLAANADKFAESTANAAQKTKGLSLAAGGLVAGMVGLGFSAAKSADDINTLSKQTGLSTSDIQKFAYASDLVDVSLETLSGSMAKLTKNMSTAQKGSGDAKAAFNALGVEFEDRTGQLRDNQDVFTEVIAALGDIENTTQRDAYAMQIFGKSAQDLNPLIMGGADALFELGNEAERAGLILSQEALDSANAFNDSVDKLKATAKGSFAAIGTEIATMLTPIIENVSESVGKFLEWLRGLDEQQLKTIGIVALVVASISPLLSIVSKLSSVVSFVATSVVPALGTALSFLAANPIVLIIAAVAALVAGIIYLWNTNDAFREGVINIWENIKNIFATFSEWLQGIFAKDWSESMGGLGDILNAFFANISNIWEATKNIFKGIIDFIKNIFTGNWQAAWQNVIDIFKSLFDRMVAIAKMPLNGVIGLINAAISGINMLVAGLNKLSFDVPDWVPGMGGNTFGFNIPEIPKIPHLAAGAVIPPQSEFLAILGDQRHGTNLEAPESLIRKIVREESSGGKAGQAAQAGFGNVVIEQFNNYDTKTDIPSLIRTIETGLAQSKLNKSRGLGGA